MFQILHICCLLYTSDTAAGFEVMRLFRELIDDEDITIVITTHDPNLMELGYEVFELSDGIVI